ncbi:MAG TPA: class I SAM-dependent methyltransferase [Chthoniobacteraceae bacterium]|nr:class I SAM-dependent methyltransferase [Chthoniobacteraceae bacterium]
MTSTLIQQASRWALPRETAAGAARRCEFHAQQINAICAINSSAHILSVACGRMPEASLSSAVQHRFFGRLVGVDPDEQALAEVSQTLGHLGVETIRGSAQTILSWSRELGHFDFIYSDGLYEAFDERFCRRLTRMLFEMLHPGGRLLAGNFLSFSKGGHSVSRRDGSAVYGRTPSTMQRLAADIPSHWLGAVHAFVAPCQTAVYLDLLRRS